MGWSDSAVESFAEQKRQLQKQLPLISTKLGAPICIISSDLNRSIRTAEVIADYFEISFDQIIRSKLLREVHYGRFEGCSLDILKELQPELFDEKGFFHRDVRIGGGESIEDLQNRTQKFLNQIRGYGMHNANATFIIVTHGGVLRTLSHLIYKRNYNDMVTEDAFGNGSIYKFGTEYIERESNGAAISIGT